MNPQSQPQPSAASIVARDNRLRRQRNRRRLVVAGTVAGVLVIGFFGLPPLLRAQAMKRLSAELHREVSIDKIRLNPFVLSVTVEGLRIKDRDGGPFTGWRRLYVNFDSFSFFTGEWRFQEIALDGFSQRVAIAQDGTFNFADLIPADSPKKQEPESAPDDSPRPIRITHLAVTSAALSFSDASRPQPFATEVGPLSFTLQNFLSAGDPKAPYEFSAITEAGESFAWKGTISVDPALRSAGEFTIGKITLKKYAPYYADLINADLLSGSLDISARYSINLDPSARELTLTGASVKLSTLQIAARGSATPLIDLPSFSIEGLSADGLKPSTTIQRISFDGGHLTVVRESDGSINLLSLLSAPTSTTGKVATLPAPTAPASSPAVAAPLPDVKLGEFAISGLGIDFEDRTFATPAKNGIGRMDVSVRNFSLAEPAAPVLLKVAVATLPEGTITIEGSAVREPLATDLKVNIAAVPLAGATPYVEPLLNIRVAAGAVSLDGNARLANAVASFQGDVVVDKFATVDGAKAQDFVKFTQLAIRGIDAKSEPPTATISEIRISDPAANIVINADKTTNLSAILRSDKPASAPTDPAATPPSSGDSTTAPEPVWSLGKFTLTNGAITISDRSIKPSARLALDHFSGTVTGLSSAERKRADVDIRGKFNGGGEIVFSGKLDTKAVTLTPGALTEISVDVKGVDLSPISPYIGTYAGYELARSGLKVDVKARLGERKLDSDNVVTLRQFTLGAATNSPEATKLPVRLGVALLKDASGDIVIDLPVKGSLDDPEFRIGRVVMRVIVNVLVKAATSPFSLLGAAFGGGGDELAYQDFSPGAAVPLEAELKKIDTLRKALAGRPALNLDITGSYDPAADLAARREQILDKQVKYRRWEELRAKNPDTPPPAEVTVSPEDEARIIGLFVSERYPSGSPTIATDGSVEPPPPLIQPLPEAPAKSSAPVMRRTHRGGFRFIPAAKAEQTKEAAPVVVAPEAPKDGATVQDGAPALTLPEARRALAAGIPVNEDELRQLAADRAQRVRDALLEGGEISADRLFVTPPAPEGKGAKVFLQLR
jgi:hypothetical protein